MRSLSIDQLIRTCRNTTIALSDEERLLFLRVRLLIDIPHQVRDEGLNTRKRLKAANVMRCESQSLKGGRSRRRNCGG
jgi:hypothetical protein